MSSEKRGFMHLQITPFRFPHRNFERRQGLTTVVADLAIMNAINGERVLIAVANDSRLPFIWSTLHDRLRILADVTVESASKERGLMRFFGGGYIQLHPRGSNTILKGSRYTAVVDDRDDGVDVSLVAEDCPFVPGHFGLR